LQVDAYLEEEMRTRFRNALEELLGKYRELAKGEFNNKLVFLREAVRTASEHKLDEKASALLIFLAGIAYVFFTPALAFEFLYLSQVEE